MRALVANRGEIAVRLIQGLEELDIEIVTLKTPTDAAHATHDAIELPSAASYMDQELIISIAKKAQCDAIIPGYGFLSESSDFAARCEQNGIIFCGPSSSILASLGNKSRAKEIAKTLNVPTLPSSRIDSADDVCRFGSEYGYPVMIKALDGGGGKGIRIVRSDQEAGIIDEAKNESPSRQVFVEKAALEGYKHIEIQVVGDRHGNIITIFERECSLQRKFQKLIEFAPSSLPQERLEPLHAASIKMAKHVNYVGLGTFEFLVDSNSNQFYFMECNPRIQVEHTITEQISGTDLVHLLYKVCLKNEKLGIEPRLCGSSIQCRINAEDDDFKPTRGTLSDYHLPSGAGIRIDSILSQGQKYELNDEYDSLLAKVITTSETYSQALIKARSAMSRLQIGCTTNIALITGLLHSPIMQQPQSIDVQTLSQPNILSKLIQLGTPMIRKIPTSSFSPISAPTSTFKKGDQFTFTLNGQSRIIKLDKILKNNFPTHISADVKLDGTVHKLVVEKSTGSGDHRKADPTNRNHVALPFPGVLVEILVDTGDQVEAGETIAIFRQGKMELDVRSQISGTIIDLPTIKEGEDVGAGALIAIVAPGRSKL